MPVQPDDAFMEGLYQTFMSKAKGMAPFINSDGAKKLTPDEISLLWNKRAMPIEKEWELHRAVNPDGSPMYSREQIGLMVYPERERLAKSGGNIEPKAFIGQANRIAQREAAKRQAAQATEPYLSDLGMEGGL